MELDLSRSELEEMLNSSCSSYYFKFEERKKNVSRVSLELFLKMQRSKRVFRTIIENKGIPVSSWTIIGLL